MFGRVIVKISGEGLAGPDTENGHGPVDKHFDDASIGQIADQVVEIIAAGTEVALVVGGGNFWRGRDRKHGMDKVRADQIGMLGTIMNALYLAEVFRMKGARARVMTPFAVGAFTEVYTHEAAAAQMRSGGVVIFAGGVGHPFFSTDSAVALRACELDVDAVLYGKSIDGVYSGDPRTDTTAKKFKTVSYRTVVSDNLNVADITAVALTRGQNIPSLVFELLAHRAIAIACENNDKIHTILGGTVVGQEMEDEFYVQ